MDHDLREILEDDDEEIVEFVNNERVYIVRNRPDHFHDWDDREFFNRFRLLKGTITNEILPNIQNMLQNRQERYHALEPLHQLLLTLRFYATGCIYIAAGDFGGIHKTTAGRIIKRVTECICTVSDNYIVMPGDQNEYVSIMQGMYRLARFPRVIGALDCTHVRIQSPGGAQPEFFRNRKGYFSLNVQAICTSDNRFINLVVRWPGSVHDSHIFNSSNIRRNFENNVFHNAVLLGDSGYPLRRYLMTPIANPRGVAENLYNESHIRTRQVIERTFGIWKRRFAILSVGIRCRIPLAQQIIMATAILHNVAILARDLLVDELQIEHIPQPQLQDVDVEGDIIRQEFVQYFANL